jgi:hypothetical protein
VNIATRASTKKCSETYYHVTKRRRTWKERYSHRLGIGIMISSQIRYKQQTINPLNARQRLKHPCNPDQLGPAATETWKTTRKRTCSALKSTSKETRPPSYTKRNTSSWLPGYRSHRMGPHPGQKALASTVCPSEG